jgi:hypothetical protein
LIGRLVEALTDAERATLAKASQQPAEFAARWRAALRLSSGQEEELRAPSRMDFARMAEAMNAPDLAEIERRLREQRAMGHDEPHESSPPEAPLASVEAAIASWVLGRR